MRRRTILMRRRTILMRRRTVLNNTNETINFIDKINLPHLKLNFDTGTILLNGNDPIEVYKYSNQYVGHIHISSPGLKPISKDMFDHNKFRNILLDHQYNKGIAVEMLTEKNNLSENIKAALEILSIYGK